MKSDIDGESLFIILCLNSNTVRIIQEFSNYPFYYK